MRINFTHSSVPKREEQQLLKEAHKEVKNIAAAKDYSSDYASVLLPLDKKQVKKVLTLARMYKTIESVIVVGIGGSNLGTLAIHEALRGKYDSHIYWADTLDAVNMEQMVEQNKKKRTLLVVVSKSGSTTETIVNFEYLQHALPEAHVVVITDKGSKLWNFSEGKYPLLEIPRKVGGRYSVFSPVGLFPLAVVGYDIKKLLKGALDMRRKCLSQTSPAARSAVTLLYHYDHWRTIANTFLFSQNLEATGKWYRQLMGESIGKEHDRNGKVVHEGMTPVVAVGSTDLHSMAQLYLGGPDDKITTFVTIQNKTKARLPTIKKFDQLVENIQGKTFGDVMHAIEGGVITAYKKAQRPYIHISLDELNEYELGQFLQFKMIEMMILGALLNVNPFDQPAVEKYKVETKRLLK